MYSAVGCYGCRPQPGLGIALLPAVTSINSVLSIVGLNSSDPIKDQERIARIDDSFRAAMSGSPVNRDGHDPVVCLRDMAAGTGLCVVGSKVAQAYAKVKWAEYQARHAAGTVGTGLISVSDIPSQIGGTVVRTLSNPIALAAIVGGAYLLLRKKGRRAT